MIWDPTQRLHVPVKAEGVYRLGAGSPSGLRPDMPNFGDLRRTQHPARPVALKNTITERQGGTDG